MMKRMKVGRGRRTSMRGRTIVLAAAVVASAAMGLVAWPGAGVREADAALAVIDSSNLAQNAAAAARLAEQLAETQNILSTLKLMKDAMGDAKSFSKAGDLAGILSNTGSAGVLGQVRRQSGIAMDFGSLRDVARLKDLISQGTSVGDFDSAKRIVSRMFRVGQGGLQGAAAADLERARAAYYVNSVEDAAAASLFNRQTAADGGTRINALLEQVRAAKTVREGLTLNTTAVLMAVEELQQMRGLLATQVQMAAARNYAQVPVAFMAGDAAQQPAQSQGGDNVFQ